MIFYHVLYNKNYNLQTETKYICAILAITIISTMIGRPQKFMKAMQLYNLNAKSAYLFICINCCNCKAEKLRRSTPLMPRENTDCKLGFLSSLCSAISFKFHHDIINQHCLCFCHSFIHFPSHYSFKPQSILSFKLLDTILISANCI